MKKKIILFSLFSLILSCDDIIGVEDISNKTVTVLAPTNNSVLNITNVNFSWQNIEDANRYTIQIATPNFENAAQLVLDSTLTATIFLKTLSPGEYEWRIKAKNSDYETLYTKQSFTIEE